MGAASRDDIDRAPSPALVCGVCGIFAACMLGACSIRFQWPRHEVEVHAEVVRPPEDFAQVYIVHDSVELLTCAALDEDRRDLPGFGLWELWEGWTLMPRAYAHGPTTPTRIGDTRVVALHQPEYVPTLGVFKPPPDQYCAVIVRWRAADTDALDAPEEPTMVGRSLWAQPTDASPRSTSIASDQTLRFEEPWVFGDEEDQRAILTLTYDVADLSQNTDGLSEDDAARQMLTNLRMSVTAIREEL